jgi:hypothetical protein
MGIKTEESHVRRVRAQGQAEVLHGGPRRSSLGPEQCVAGLCPPYVLRVIGRCVHSFDSSWARASPRHPEERRCSRDREFERTVQRRRSPQPCYPRKPFAQTERPSDRLRPVRTREKEVHHTEGEFCYPRVERLRWNHRVQAVGLLSLLDRCWIHLGCGTNGISTSRWRRSGTVILTCPSCHQRLVSALKRGKHWRSSRFW